MKKAQVALWLRSCVQQINRAISDVSHVVSPKKLRFLDELNMAREHVLHAIEILKDL